MIDLHYWPTPNGKKVTIMLEEASIPYRIVPVNIIGCLAWAYVTPKFGEVAGQVFGWLWRLVTGG